LFVKIPSIGQCTIEQSVGPRINRVTVRALKYPDMSACRKILSIREKDGYAPVFAQTA